MTATTTLPRSFAPYGSRLDHDYLPRLEAFADDRGYRIIDGHWECTRRLASPRHRCTRCGLQSFHQSGVLDHVIRLLARDGSRWALLSQLYDHYPDELNAFVAEVGADRWEYHGRAPYPMSTAAILIVGRTESQR